MDFLIVILWEYSSKCNLFLVKKFNDMLIVPWVPTGLLGIFLLVIALEQKYKFYK